ncbi:hypothetical protein Goari_025523, partial [Gossypium aridum]|nr:hypothetical protein [Gossypium aridum]
RILWFANGGPKWGVPQVLVNSFEGIPFRFTNGLDIDINRGVVYFTDSNILFQRRYADLLLRSSTDRTGRLFIHDPRAKKASPKVFAEIPYNIKMNDKGELWVALNTGRLRETSNDGSDPIGVKYDGEGCILQELDGNGGAIFNSINEVNEELCPLIKNVLLLDSEGKRIAVKYYSDDWPTNSAKEAFEK